MVFEGLRKHHMLCRCLECMSKGTKMPDYDKVESWKDRLKTEFFELADKNDMDHKLLITQNAIMLSYMSILSLRINRSNNG